MNEIGFRTARTTAIAAVFFVMLMLGVPSYFAPGQQLTTTTNAAAEDVQRDFIIGVSELSVSTLNPNTYTMVGESMLIFPCYSTLLQYDKTMDNIIGDVAEDWSCSPDGLTWYFKLVDNAYFCDPAAPDDTSHQLKASDVEFSFMGLQNEDGSRLHTYFPNIIESFTIINDFEFEITLNGPFATIMESWLGAMILPEYYWAGEDFLNFDNAPPIGSGRVLLRHRRPSGGGNSRVEEEPDLVRHREPRLADALRPVDHQGGAERRRRLDRGQGRHDRRHAGCQPRDVRRQPPGAGSTPDVVGYSQGNGFVYEFNLNQMSDALREDLGGQFLSGENNQLLLDEDVKLAMSLCVDKYGFIDDVLYGLGSYADSLVTPQNPGHYWYPDPDPYDPETARQTLWDAGWQYYMNGTHIAYGSEDYYKYYPLCKVGGTDPLQFGFVTLSNDVLWTVAAKYIVNTTRLGGFDLQLSIESTNDMNSMWYQADYDVWLWDWVIGVTADPVNTMEIFWSGAIGTDQDVYWVNDTFDEIYYEAQVTMDPVARRDLTDQLQSMAYEMRGCQCVAYREELYAVYIGEWAQESLGDWENDYYMLPDIWPWWLSMSIYPNDNNAPDLYSYPTEVDAEVDVAEIFTANALDDDSETTLEYRWFWGNGEKSDWSTSTSASYTYPEDGIYMADVAVREKDSSMGFEDYFMVSKQFKVTVRDLSNEAPSISAWSCEPAAPDTGTDMWFNATAVDPEGDDIYYVWTFGDGHSEYSEDVRHQFTEDDSYTVTLSVDDQHIGADGSRPVTASALVAVARNHEPTVSVPDVAGIYSKEANTFTVTSDDADPLDELLYTWFWGDGGVSVTTEPTADYTYNSKGTFTMTVYADDQTGLDGHNATDTGLVSVLSRTTNKLPVPSVLSVTDATPYTGQTVTFSGSATDRDGDALTLTIEFGDGTFEVVEYPVSADNLVRPISADKSYADAGTYTAYLYVSDQVANVSSGPLSIVVEANDAPIFDEPLEAELGDTGEPMSFSAGVYDPDGDTMSYYWTWGDGTDDVTAGPTATHTYDESGTYQYRLYVNDGFSHNETSYNTAEVNAVPVLSALPARTIDAGVEITFTADASDPDLTAVLTFEWDFGDLSPTEYGVEVTHTYSATGDYTYSVTVTDGFALPTHTLYDEATVTVSDPAWTTRRWSRLSRTSRERSTRC